MRTPDAVGFLQVPLQVPACTNRIYRAALCVDDVSGNRGVTEADGTFFTNADSAKVRTDQSRETTCGFQDDRKGDGIIL